MKTMVALRRAAFFYPGPILCDPGLDTFLIALQRASRGLLWREAQSMQDSADMRRVILNPELALDQPRHPRTRPQVRRQSGCQRALHESLSQPRQVTGGQASRSAAKPASGRLPPPCHLCERLLSNGGRCAGPHRFGARLQPAKNPLRASEALADVDLRVRAEFRKDACISPAGSVA